VREAGTFYPRRTAQTGASRAAGYAAARAQTRPAQQEAGVAIFNKRKANGFQALERDLAAARNGATDYALGGISNADVGGDSDHLASIKSRVSVRHTSKQNPEAVTTARFDHFHSILP
jgi:hypothetical protein